MEESVPVVDVSGTPVDVSGTPVDVSGTPVDVSGTPVDVSGTPVDVSGTPVDVSGTPVDVSGTPVDVSGTLIDLSGSPPPPPPPPTLTLAEIMAAQEVLLQKEAADKATLESIGTLSVDELKTKLIRWAVMGYPNNYAIHDIVIQPPPVCSDGLGRPLNEYIEFCSGKTIHQHVAALQQTLPDIVVSFSYTGTSIQIVVLKA